MKLKDEKGYVGVDISIAVIILLIIVPTIMGMVYNINSSKNVSKVKSEAISIAVNALEAAKKIELADLDDNSILEALIADGLQIDTTTIPAIITTARATYKLVINVTDYKGDNLVKTVKAIVTYKVGRQEKNIELSTVLKWLEEIWNLKKE